MKARRSVLALGLGLLVVSAGRVSEGSTGEVEVAGYGGTTSGGWICGPAGRVAYGGVGADVRMSQRSNRDPNGPGATGVMGASLENQSFECTDSCETYFDENGKPIPSGPPAAVLFGARARGGYTWKHFGVEGGAMVFQSWESSASTSPKTTMAPELELQGGTHGDTTVYGVMGIGSRGVTTHQRPSLLYTGVTLDTEEGRIDLRMGPARTGPATLDSVAWRMDLSGRVKVSEDFAIRAGGAAAFPEGSDLDGEGSIGIVGGF